MLEKVKTSFTPQDLSNPRYSDFSLDDRYLRQDGEIILTGIQALVRIPLDQHRADHLAGLNTATFISGYRGSPLGGLDLTLQQHANILKDYQVVFQPGVNEELAATAVFGSQTANMLPNPRYDGVIGMWYGKAPGVDRCGDVFRHANYAGVGRYGGVLAIAGDDPISKSSTVPSHSEPALYDVLSPTLYPGNMQDVLDFGRLGIELSRYSGLWTGFKIVTNIADGFGVAEVSRERIRIQRPDFEYRGKPWQHTQSTNLLVPYSLQMEEEIHNGRLEAALAFARTNDLNKITVSSADDWIGIVAAGKTYFDLRQSLQELGLSDNDLRSYGVRLLKVGMVFPMEPEIILEFADGLDEILVIEEKRAFMEMFIKDILYARTERPVIVGKHDESGAVLVKPHGELNSDEISRILVKRIADRVPVASLSERVSRINTPVKLDVIPLLSRTPFFCSGCPHNSSTTAPDQSLVAAGIGCHTMTLLMPDREVIGITQMGGEGAQWVGMSPFTKVEHIFQNLGDGTLFHSGSMAIRQAIAGNVNITYKILFNSAVAMTGGQVADGGMSIPNLVTSLKAEGAGKIIITTEENPDNYLPGVSWPVDVEIWHRDRLMEAQETLEKLPGVTVLIHDQECAAELRRKRRRGLAPDPAQRVIINEAVCEGCGDCGEKSNCLSVYPVDTEFGRKTQIHQGSCNKDYSCLKGDCPAFLTIVPGEVHYPWQEVKVSTDLPEPTLKVDPALSNIYMMGIGGTGVVTVNQVLATAAFLDGKDVIGLDQTGLSQKGGPVVANLKIRADKDNSASRVSAKSADAYLVFDLLTGSDPKNLMRANPDKTIAIISTSEVPTGSMVTSTEVKFPQSITTVDTTLDNTRREDGFVFDATGIAETLYGTHMPTNLMVLGAAYQRGLIPVSAEAIERAINLNGVAVKMSLHAFRVGRQAVVDPKWLDTVNIRRTGMLDIRPQISDEARTLIEIVPDQGELRRLLKIRVPELIAYQNKAYAEQYVTFVKFVFDKETALNADKTEITEAVARYLFKLMAYKDEYEVARLHMKPEFKTMIKDDFGADARYDYMLHPPFLRALGMKKKIKLGRWFDPAYRLLIKMKFLRGTPFDLFGYAKVRRVERQLIKQYRQLMTDAMSNLKEENYSTILELARLPDIVRGYEDIKLRNVEKFENRVHELGFQVS